MITQTSVDETISLLTKLIQNKCVNPPGNELNSIKTIKNFLKSKEIECTVFETATNRANLLARIKGTENGPKIMFGPSHVDVCPVPNIDDWSVGPFSGEIKDGFIWGRGGDGYAFYCGRSSSSVCINSTGRISTEGRSHSFYSCG